MSETNTCPRCGGDLSTVEDQEGSLHCNACQGTFVPAGQVRDEFLAAAAAIDKEAENASADAPLVCPGCGTKMQALQLGGSVLDRCENCGGVWLDPREGPGEGPGEAEAESPLARYLLYSLSLPERVVRSTIGLAAGAVKETAEFIVPQAFQSSKTYEVVIRNSLKFLTEDVGGAASKPGEESEVPENYIAKKAVGNFIDLAGLATLHLSPLWVLAVVSDVAYGSKTYVLELAKELKEQGLIDDDSTIHHVDDVLEALQKTTGSAASVFDTPPLSIDELKKVVEETRKAATSADPKKLLPESEISRFWNDMKEISEREDVSLLDVSGAMTLHTLDKLHVVAKGALTGVRVAGGMFQRHVFDHYQGSLDKLRQDGFYKTVQESCGPYVEAVWNNFASERKTWTEKLLSTGDRITGSTFETMRNWLSWTSPQDKK